MPAELAHYTITGAQDWPMFKEMLAGTRILFVILWGTGVAGGRYAWKDLRAHIAAQRTEDQTHCCDCKAGTDNEFKYVWDALDVVAPRSPEAAAIVKAAKQRLDNA